MHRHSVLIYFLAFFFLVFAGAIFAEEGGSAGQDILPSLEVLVPEALQNNRDIQAMVEQLAAAKHRVPQSSALPNPTAGYAFMGSDLETPLGPQSNIYEFEQEVPFPGKLLEKRKMADAEVSATEAKLKMTQQDVLLKLSEAYYDLFATDEALRVVGEISDLLKNFESIAQARYASQQGEQRDVAKAQTEVSETLERLFILRQQKETLLALLKAILNRRSALNFGKAEELQLPLRDLSVEELLLSAKENRPELLEADAMLNRDRHANNLAKYEYAPDFSVGFQYSRIDPGDSTDPGAGRDAWMIPVKVTLPIWQNRIGPAVLEAKNNLKSTEAKFEEAQNLSEYEIKSAYYRFTSAKQVAELYENAFIPEAELAFRSDQAGYEAGRVDILNFIDSERVYLNAKVAYYQALAEAMKSFAALERAVGKKL